MDKKELELPREVAAKFELTGNHGVGEYHYGGKIVHLERIDLAAAERLVKAGFPYLVEKGAKASPKSSPGGEDLKSK